jgi:DNA-directed RNA polymerase subunit RPC12/RpoP
MTVIPCVLCGKDLEQRTTKNKKPYFVCDPCGTQFFVRRKQGIEKLEELVRALHARELPMCARTRTVYEISAILAEIDGVKQEIKKLENRIGLFRADTEEVRARKLLKMRLRNLLMELERICTQE